MYTIENDNTKHAADAVVYCFSGTGNCLFAARKIAAGIGAEVVLITREGVEKGAYPDCETAVVVFPSYAYGLPSLVCRFLRVMPLPKTYLAAVVTYGSVYGGTLRHAVKRIEKRGGRVDYTGSVAAVENFLPIFGAPKADVKAHRLTLTDKQGETAAAEIGAKVNRVDRRAPFYAGFVSAMFRSTRPILSTTMRIHKSCTGCGLCVQVCPGAALYFTDKPNQVRPKRKHRNCEICQACVNVCPHNSITMFRATKKSGRYFHPEIKMTDMRVRPARPTNEENDA